MDRHLALAVPRLRSATATAVAVAVALLATLAVPPVAADRATSEPDTTAVGAAVLASRAVVADGSATSVVLVRDDAFPDALAAAPLLTDGASLLYVPGGADGRLPAAVAAEVARALPAGAGCDSPVRIVGGPAAVSAGVERSLMAAGWCVQRVAGEDRVATSLEASRLAVAERPSSAGDVPVLLASADTWFDAMPAIAVVPRLGALLALNPGDHLDPRVEAFLEDHAGTVTVVGGQRAVSTGVMDELSRIAPTSRVAGVDRVATSRAVSDLVGSSTTMTVSGYGAGAWRTTAIAGAAAAVLGANLVYSHETHGDRATQDIGGIIERIEPETGPLALPVIATDHSAGFDPLAYDFKGRTGVRSAAASLTAMTQDRWLRGGQDMRVEGLHVPAGHHLGIRGGTLRVRDAFIEGQVRAVEAEATSHLDVAHCTTDSDKRPLFGRTMVVRHCDITGREDGLVVMSGPLGDPDPRARRSLVEYSWIHRDGTKVGDRHHDGIQLWQGGNLTVRRNRIEGWDTSAILLQSNRGPVANVEISQNHLEGGGHYTLYVRDRGHGRPQWVDVTDNVFGRGAKPVSTGSKPHLQATFVRTSRERLEAYFGGNEEAAEWIVWDGNTWEDTGEVVRPPGGWRTPDTTDIRRRAHGGR